MSKIRQSFTREQIEYKLNEKTDTLIELDERTNLQELVNSHYDETLYYNLERYFADNVSILPPDDDTIVDDIELEGTKADRMLSALQHVQTLRTKYGIPEYYSDHEVLRFLREKASAGVAEAEKNEKNENEGGELNEEEKTESQS